MGRESDIDKLRVQHARLIAACVRRLFIPCDCLDIDDYQSEALVGLMRAYDTFDPARGTAFTTHLVNNITWAIKEARRTQSRNPQAVSLTIIDPDGVLIASPIEEPHRMSTKRERQIMAKVIAKIGGKRGALLRAVLADGSLSLDQAAEQVGIDPAEVRRAFRRALRRAREIANDEAGPTLPITQVEDA